MPIRILLVDDHEVVRDGVARLLDAQPGMRVVASVGAAPPALAFAEQEEPDVAIVDVAMPQQNGIELVRRLHDLAPATRVLMLSMHATAEYVCRAFLAGAQGDVVKESAARALVDAVRAVHSGQRYLCPKVDGAALYSQLGGGKPADPLAKLSPREREVLQYMVEGHTGAETALRLGLSPKSVETYRSRLMAKLEIADLPSLVKFAIRRGITSVD